MQQNDSIKKEIKKTLQFLKMLRRLDHVSYNAMVNGDIFKEKVIKPLEKISDWAEEDQKIMEELAETVKKEVQSKTLKEKSEKIRKIMEKEAR